MIFTLLSSIALAQRQTNSLSGAAEPVSVVRIGAEGFDAVLLKTIDCKRTRVGDPVLAKTTDDVQLSKGLLIPKGAKIIGHVSEVQRKNKGILESKVGIVFEKALLADGKMFPLQLSVLKISDPEDQNPRTGGMQIDLESNGGSQALLIRSNVDNVRVESGSHLLLRIIGPEKHID